MLRRLIISNLRNIQQLEVTFDERCNLITGRNGSGKTSILEGIHYLSLARSFRSHLNNRVIRHNQTQLSVFGELDDGNQLGIEKNQTGLSRIRLNSETVSSAGELALLLPLQLINPDGYLLLEGGPKGRRRFLDWGVFHVEPPFLTLWQRLQRCLKNRNSALRQRLHKKEIMVWNNELLTLTHELSPMRTRYIEVFTPCFQELLQQLLPNYEIRIHYYPGWNQQYTLAEALENSFHQDHERGYTQFGPHRADIKITIDRIPIADVLSRGQLKLAVCALQIAQGLIMKQLTAKKCLYLIDDLAAELDEEKRAKILGILNQLNTQVFITAISPKSLHITDTLSSHKMFHVEQGHITER